MYDWLHEAVAEFGSSCKAKLTGGGGSAEAAIRGPLETLLKAVAEHHDLGELTWHDEVRIPDLGVRPDYALRQRGATIGYLEVKKPGLSVDPETFTGHNKRQWHRLRDIPNLAYTNGTEWRIFRDGVQFGETVRLTGELRKAGGRLAPADPAALDALLRTFVGWGPPGIGHVSRLVQHIAPLCRLLRAAVREQLAAESRSTAPEDDARTRPFTGLKSDWRRLLFPSADDATFADGYAQTVTFALLLARTENIPLTTGGLHEVGRRLDAGHALMGKALQLLTDNVNERFSVTLDLLTSTINRVDWPVIRRGNRDAYMHLYEKFLTVYDPELRQRSGSYYTPRDVVDDMVRLTEDVLRSRLSKAEGYGQDDVRIVDPSMGTGTYLHSIIERVAERASAQHGPAMRQDAIERLARRLFGFEVQMGPYAVAELRTSDLLKRYEAPLPERGLNLFVTDTLDNPYVEEEELASTYGVLSDSRRRANLVKGTVPVTVVIANPPYDDKAENRGGWVEKRPVAKEKPLLDEFRLPGNGRYEHVLKNMYIYFWRWATWKVFDAHDEDRHGVVSFITPSGFATGPGGRGMRDYLRRTCDEGWIINLSPEGQRADVGTRIFPKVAQPLAICIFLRRADADPGRMARIHYRSVHGRQAEKFRQLNEIRLDDDGWRDVHEEATRPFTPASQSGWDDFPELNDLFPWGSPGVKANRSWVTSPSPEILRRRWARLIREQDREEKARLFKETDTRALGLRRDPLPGLPCHAQSLADEVAMVPDLVPVALRSFDRQWLIADHRVLDRARPELWEARLPGQIYLNQQSSHEIETGPAVMATALIPDTHHFNGRGGRVLPLLHPDGSANVPAGLLPHLTGSLGTEPVTVHDLAAYTVAVAGHTLFTEQFTEELLTPGVRLPLTRNPETWQRAVELGAEVLWIMTYGMYGCTSVGVEFGEDDPRRIRYLSHVGEAVPETLRYDSSAQTLHLGHGAFGPVTPSVWEFDVGGMRVVRKWFGYRKASPNSKKTSPLDDIHTDRWPEAWTTELIELLSVLRRLNELIPVQRELLAAVLAGPVVTEQDLKNAGVLPVRETARKARRRLADGLFADPDAG
ncbi:type ISP restriction/modification enzyme [Streptomyces sp. WAC 06738]|uniref:type ISP restriction/modification enzyme n=1 Tax=Streptomyces sp. WAC 06738 TaxID=2203210 RepID=UPI001F0BF560|nr:type ISP restriction/modification enzyme [Streptomyces sp. WAC 06738]